jgi:hypothetical protein
MIEPDELVNLAYDHTYGFGGYSVADQRRHAHPSPDFGHAAVFGEIQVGFAA